MVSGYVHKGHMVFIYIKEIPCRTAELCRLGTQIYDCWYSWEKHWPWHGTKQQHTVLQFPYRLYLSELAQQWYSQEVLALTRHV